MLVRASHLAAALGLVSVVRTALGFRTRFGGRPHQPSGRTRPPALSGRASDGGAPDPRSASTDWMEAELTLRSFPPDPDPSLPPDLVAVSCCRALQFVDHPTPSAGLRRVFPFFTWECRKVVTARRGGDTVERFVEHGLLSPALQPFMGATRIELGEGTLTPRTLTRGDLMSFPVTVYGAAVLAFQHSSGMIRDRVGEGPPRTDIVIRLERERRPPLQGCWLVREVLDVRHAFAGDMGNVHVGG